MLQSYTRPLMNFIHRIILYPISGFNARCAICTFKTAVFISDINILILKRASST